MITRLFMSIGAIFVFLFFNRAHEIMSPLVSGPMAAQQLTDSNAAYIGTRVTASLFNGSGISDIVLLITLVLIWLWPFPKKENKTNA